MKMEKRAVIVGAGEFAADLLEIRDGDFVIAADGGYEYLKKLGRGADLVLGDFDSLGYVPGAGERVEVFPPEKDDTDLMLSVKKAMEWGADTILIHGALGLREDHSYAAVQVLNYIAQRGKVGFLVGDRFSMCVICGGEQQGGELQFGEDDRGLVSVFAQKKSSGVWERGLKYELRDAELEIDCPVGVSNELTGKAASVGVKEGQLLVMWQSRICGIPKVCRA